VTVVDPIAHVMVRREPKILRLILGDQLNAEHSWFRTVRPEFTYVMMEVRSETDYVHHHIQKVVGFFSAMRHFAEELKAAGHNVVYLKLDDPKNTQSIAENCRKLIAVLEIEQFEYQEPDEYRVDEHLKELASSLSIPFNIVGTEHFFTSRIELADHFRGKKTYLMESFYRAMRRKHRVLMDGDKPLTGQWNYDHDNRKKLPKGHMVPTPLRFANEVSELVDLIRSKGIRTIGNIDPKIFIWPVNREQSLQLLDHFIHECLPLFGTFEDSMTIDSWSVYHSRLSFTMNLKLLSPRKVIDAAINAWEKDPEKISFNQLEGFVRQILGWREFMRGVYWAHMPEYSQLNFFGHTAALPEWFWTGNTKMNCLKHAIGQSLDHAYAHHIQRLMVTGNFALLAGVHPDELDKWYLGVYIDALDWVEITNTRGMSQFADGGIVGTKPYVSSAAYIDKMSDYCGSCYYNKREKVGDRACPFNSLYWNFYDHHVDKLKHNPRIGMMYKVWDRMSQHDRTTILEQAEKNLERINEL
jgi:deoxyribodipyrimidine photolyase-related protein